MSKIKFINHKKKANPLFKRLKGYQKAPRDRFRLLSEKFLTIEEFVLYELLIAITDWDISHDTFGTFNATNSQLAEILGWKDDSTVSRYKRNLINKKLLISSDYGLKPKYFSEWQIRKSAKTQTSSANLQTEYAKIQNDSANSPGDYIQKHNQSLVSSKYNLSSLDSRNSNDNTDEEYTEEELIESFNQAETRGEI